MHDMQKTLIGIVILLALIQCGCAPSCGGAPCEHRTKVYGVCVEDEEEGPGGVYWMDQAMEMVDRAAGNLVKHLPSCLPVESHLEYTAQNITMQMDNFIVRFAHGSLYNPSTKQAVYGLCYGTFMVVLWPYEGVVMHEMIHGLQVKLEKGKMDYTHADTPLWGCLKSIQTLTVGTEDGKCQ